MWAYGRPPAAWGARQFNNSRNQQLFFNEEERVDDLLIVDGCALPARCAPIPPNQTNAAYRGPSAIPLLALCVINIQFDSTKFHLWLLDSYPLHINYCYNIFSFQQRKFTKWIHFASWKEKLIVFLWVKEWMNEVNLLTASSIEFKEFKLRSEGLWGFRPVNPLHSFSSFTLPAIFNKNKWKSWRLFFWCWKMNEQGLWNGMKSASWNGIKPR